MWDRHFWRGITAASVLVCVFAGAAAHGQAVGNGGDNGRAAARRAAVAAARGQVEAASARLKAAEQRIRADAKANPATAAAETELDQAQAELDRLGVPVLARLRDSDAAYQAALKDEGDAQTKLGQEQAKAVAEQPATTRPSTVPADASLNDDITAQTEESSLNVPVPTDGQVVAAVDKLDIRSKRRELERQALAADPATADASARVEAAAAKLKQLRAELDARMLNDPEYKAARDQLATARAEMTRAAAANY